MAYKEIVFSFENGGNPDTYQLAMSHGLTCEIDLTRKEIITTVEEKEVERVQRLVTEAGYQFKESRNPRLW